MNTRKIPASEAAVLSVIVAVLCSQSSLIGLPAKKKVVTTGLERGSLGVGVTPVAPGGDLMVSVSVDLEDSAFHSGECLTLGASAVATFDGKPMTLVRPGGIATPSHISGMTVDMNMCVAPAFSLTVAHPSAETPTTSHEIVVAAASAKLTATVPGLLFERTLTISPTGPIKPGQHVEVRMAPPIDDIPEWELDRSVSIWGGGKNAWVEGKNLSTKGGVFAFDMPSLPAGPAHLDVHFGSRPPRVRFSSCHARSCTGETHNGPATIGFVMAAP
ncbi:MAG: hypothetical protein ACJ790_11945 [Myxococcaceae bacterium]